MDIQQTVHRIGIVVGTVVLAAGVVLLFAESIAASLAVNALVVDLLALGAVGLGVWTARERYHALQNETAIPAVERVSATPTPGDEIDDLIYRMNELREGTIEYRERIQERVAEIAIAVMTYRDDCSREQAIERLEAGTWTDDALAAGFFTGVGATVNRSIVDQIVDRFSDAKTPYEQQLQRTVDAIEDVAEFGFDGDGRSTDESAGTSYAPLALADGDQVAEGVWYRSRLRTHHWSGISAFAFLAVAAGLLASRPALLLAGAVGIGTAGYAHLLSPPPLSDLAVTRRVDEAAPEPGDEIEVTVTVENTGSTLLPDLRLVERVPPAMEVVDGSARLGTALRPGGSTTFGYTVVAERGEHTWPLQVLGRDASGAVEREAVIEPDTTVNCVPRLTTVADMPVRMQTSVYAGEVATNVGGEGLEFHSVRDYQPGDPKRRIDWKTYARTGEFSTIDFREEHAARVVLMFDGRESSYVSTSPGRKHALDRSVDVAFDVYASLHDQGHLIGIAAFNGIPCWLGPGTGTLHLQRVRQLFTEHPAISPLPPDAGVDTAEGRYIDPMTHVRRQLPENTQIFLFSPLTDEYTYEVARQLDGAGHLVTVVSPDPTAGRTVGQRIARLERAVLIKQLRDHRIRVVDLAEDGDMNVELEHAKQRWTA